ncbi:MAG TPA: hypothetical protein VFV99_02820 [Kofleriaceae bacterium]|nr:hypothetical protein [Kofleriaceae bacterium]
MRTSEVDPNASGEIEIPPPAKPQRVVDKKTVVVDKRGLLPIRKPRALTIKE